MNTLQPRWGINFPRPTSASGGLPLISAPVPERLIIPLNQSMGAHAKPSVTEGERVLKGQPLTSIEDNTPGARIHASSSGIVRTIAIGPVTGRDNAIRVEIETDGKDQPWSGYQPIPDPLNMSAMQLRETINEAGIVGLGGAMFPTDIKLNSGQAIVRLILNGVECEPRINCDDALMQTAAGRILAGAQSMLHILNADACLIALKENTQATVTMQAALQELGDNRFTIHTVPAVYPAGGERQLIELLTGIEVPTGCLPPDCGIVCQNVATAEAIGNFHLTGEPLISRIVTVSGAGIARPVNVHARIGTPLSVLAECAGGYTPAANRLIMGGSMMGIALPDDELPVTKGCNSIYVAAANELAIAREMPCIRCGDCSIVCPVNLMPQLLLQTNRGNDYARMEVLGLADCIECGCCDYVCPSQIPLTQNFRDAKTTLREINFEKHRATKAEQRHQAHTERLESDAAAEELRLLEQTKNMTDTTAGARDALQELLRRTEANKTKENKTKDDSA